ncbi:MAG TPA: glycerophosphodiester phosphodiesterase family protein [Flavobacteriaceae bacterium]|nr:glycerophosphodiester phosphodiesterase family protein [Flavobacteriaceae bacterium]
MKKIGHRGAKGHVAENTLESIQKALDLGVDMVEIDVHRCKSGELVVIHDFTLDRTTNGSGEITKFSLQELKKLKVENQFEIPLLTEVLDAISGKCQLNIELKGLNTAQETCRIVEGYVQNRNWDYSDFIVSSFQKNELFQVLDRNKNIPLAVLSKASLAEAMILAKQLRAKILHPALGIVTKENIAEAKTAGFQINVWTVNDSEAIARMKALDVDGIISDFPDRF